MKSGFFIFFISLPSFLFCRKRVPSFKAKNKHRSGPERERERKEGVPVSLSPLSPFHRCVVPRRGNVRRRRGAIEAPGGRCGTRSQRLTVLPTNNRGHRRPAARDGLERQAFWQLESPAMRRSLAVFIHPKRRRRRLDLILANAQLLGEVGWSSRGGVEKNCGRRYRSLFLPIHCRSRKDAFGEN